MHASAPPQPTSALPWWARAIDLATIVALLLLVSNVFFGGFRFRAGDFRVTATSPLRTALVALVLAAVRHWLVRRPALYQRVADGVRHAWASQTRRIVFPAFVGSRTMVLFVGFMAVVLIGYAPKTPPFRVSRNELVNLPVRWDAGWYLQLALDGYDYHPEYRPERQQNIAFFPAYPLIVRFGASWLGSRSAAFGDKVPGNRVEWEYFQHRRVVLSSMIVSLGSFAWALVYLFRLARETLDEDAAVGAVLVACAYPYSIFFGAMYTESLFLLTTIAAFYHLRRDEWGHAAIWGLIAGLTRPNGCLLSVPLAIVALQRAFAEGRTRQSSLRAVYGLAAAAAPGIGMLMFSAFVYQLTGRPLAWMDAHRAWGRVGTDVWALLANRLSFIFSESLYTYLAEQPIELLNVVPTVAALLLVVPVARRIGVAAGLLIVLMVVPPLFRGGFLSLGRVTSTLFPLFLWAGLVWRGSARSTAIVVMAGLQAFLAVLFFTWRPFY